MLLPGSPRMPSICTLGFSQRADAGEVGLPEAVDLDRSDHHVTPSAPDAVEHARERHVAGGPRAIVAARSERHRLLDEERFGIGHHELGGVRQLGETRGQSRHDADARGEHLAVAAPGLGGGDDEQFREREFARSCLEHRQRQSAHARGAADAREVFALAGGSMNSAQ